MDGTDVWGRPRVPRQEPVWYNISLAINEGAKAGPAVYMLAAPTRYPREARRIWPLFYPSFIPPVGTSNVWDRAFAHHQCQISRQSISLRRIGKRRSTPTQAQAHIS